jgi:general nucleoside transport system permease protein
LKAAPLMLCAVGLAIGFRGNVWNIGAEGQLTLGAIFGGWVALGWGDTGSPLVLPAIILAGALGGAAWAAVVALLRTRFNASEILTSLMLTYVAIQLLGYLVNGPWRDPDGFAFPETKLFGDAAVFPILVDGTRLHLGVLMAPIAVAAAALLMGRSLLGFQVRVVGLAPRAGDYAGFSRARIIWTSLLISGAFAGLAGVGEAMGPIGQLQPVISPGYGFAAIIVAFLGRLHALGIAAASLLMALLYLGGETAQIALGLPLAVTGVFQGMLLFYVLAADIFIHYRLRPGRPAAEPAE